MYSPFKGGARGGSLLFIFIFVVVVYTYESACEGEGLAVGSEDGGVDVACRWQEDSDRYKGDAEDSCHGGDEELYFDIRAFHFSG